MGEVLPAVEQNLAQIEEVREEKREEAFFPLLSLSRESLPLPLF